MKRINYILILLSLVAMVSCMDKYTEFYTANSPVYLSYDSLRSAVKSVNPTELNNPGKIYFKDNFLFVVEKLKGIHVFDMTVPSSPQNLKFIPVPGCVDIAIKNNILYADSYVDLVAVDISSINSVKEVARVKDVFPYTVPPTNNELRVEPVDQTQGIVTAWEVTRQKKDINYQNVPVYPVWSYYEKNYAMYDAVGGFKNGAELSSSGTSAASYGKSGSMARFGLYDKYLYSVDNNQVYTFNVQNPASPVKLGMQYLGWNIETMFLYDNHMFLGTNSGMIIASLQNPLIPTQVGSYAHITSCDPVIVDDGYAYVTLRGGQTCRNTTVNRLDVLKLAVDYKTVSPVAFYNLTNPHGLGIDGNTLFVCDGSDGLKVYDCTDKTTIDQHLIKAFPAIQSYDVIPVNTSKYLFMVGDGGFYLYDYSNLNDIRKIATIEVKEKK